MTDYRSKHILTEERQIASAEEISGTVKCSVQQSIRKAGEQMPLTMAQTGRINQIRKIGGKSETRRFLESLGFVVGGDVTVVSELNGNLIVNVKESRVAISREMANKIMV